MKLARVFSAHPASVGETYAQHLVHAAAFGGRMLVAGLACLVHAVFPFLFINTGSDAVRQLHDVLSTRRQRATSTEPAAAGEAVRS